MASILLRTIVVVTSFITSTGLTYVTSWNKVSPDFLDELPQSRRLYLGLLLTTMPAFLNGMWLSSYAMLSMFYLHNMSTKRQVRIHAATVLLEVMLFSMIVTGLYFENQFLPWNRDSCKHVDMWKPTADGRNLLDELWLSLSSHQRQHDYKTSKVVCKDLVLVHQSTVALLVFMGLSWISDSISIFELVLALQRYWKATWQAMVSSTTITIRTLFYLPGRISAAKQKMVGDEEIQKQVLKNIAYNEKRLANVSLPMDILYTIAEVGELHHRDVYNLRYSSKRLTTIFFGDDPAYTLRKLSRATCNGSEKINCHQCDMQMCKDCERPSNSKRDWHDHLLCLPYCQAHYSTVGFQSNLACRAHPFIKSDRCSDARPCQLCSVRPNNRLAKRFMAQKMIEARCRRRLQGMGSGVRCTTCDISLPTPSSRYWMCFCGSVCERGINHDMIS